MKLTTRARDGIWMLSYTDDMGARKRVSLATRDRAVAERVAHQTLAGNGPRQAQKTVADALDMAWRSRWESQKGASRSTYVVEALRRSMGKAACSDVTYGTLETLVAGWRAAGTKPSTINQRLSYLSVALDLAAKRHWIVACPPMPRQSVRNAKLRFISHAEEQLLRTAAVEALSAEDAVLMDLLITVLVDTGARLSEITTLPARNLRDGEILLEDTKNGRSRVVPLTDGCEASLRRLLRHDRWVQVTARTADSPTRKASAKDFLVKLFTRVRNRAGMPDVSLHTLRHTCASRLVAAGVSIYEVKEWLGHSSVTVTERYAHLGQSRLREAAVALARPVGTMVPLRSVK